MATKEEALEFAKNIEESIAQRNPKILNDAIDLDLLMSKMNLEISSMSQSGLKEGVSKKMKFGSEIIESIGQKGSYKLVKEYAKGDTLHLLFRVYAGGALNYNDFELAHTKGQCKIADAFIYLSGENISETMANIYKFLDNGNGPSDKDLESLKKVSNIRQLLQTKDYEGAKKEYGDLPAHVQNMKTVQLLNVMISAELPEDSAYTKAIENFHTLYPEESNIYLMEIDGFYLKGQYKKALDAVNNLDKQINTDPLLDYQRSLLYKTMNDTANQKKSLFRLVKNMPDFQEGYIELIGFNLRNKMRPEAEKLITEYKKHPKFDMEFLNTVVNNYKNF